MKVRWYNNIGPATLVAAAFIGPGTVTICSLAGATHGFTLLWALTLSIVATVVLQEMSARLGIVTQQGLGESIRSEISTPIAKLAAIILILTAIIKYKWLEKLLIALVLTMSISFVIAAVLSKPNLVEIFKGAFLPSVPDRSLLTIIGLIGTTVVPYNLFLHASLVKEKWNKPEDLAAVRKDIYISIIAGGLVSMAIVIVATNAQGEIKNVVDMARSVWMIILVLGVTFSLMGWKSITVIKIAQVANGILLPVIACYLLWIVNRKGLMGKSINSTSQNILGVVIILVTLVLSTKSLWSVLG